VETSYLASQSEESSAQSFDSTEACSKPGAYNCLQLNQKRSRNHNWSVTACHKNAAAHLTSDSQTATIKHNEIIKW